MTAAKSSERGPDPSEASGRDDVFVFISMKLRVRIQRQTSKLEVLGPEPTVGELTSRIRETLLSSHGLRWVWPVCLPSCDQCHSSLMSNSGSVVPQCRHRVQFVSERRRAADRHRSDPVILRHRLRRSDLRHPARINKQERRQRAERQRGGPEDGTGPADGRHGNQPGE